VLVLHPDPLIRTGLTAALGREADFEVCLPEEQPAPASAALAMMLPRLPTADVVIADYGLALKLLAQARRDEQVFGQRHALRVLIVSPRQSELEIRHAFESGARGYLQLGCGLHELASGVRALHRGLRHLGELAAQRMAESLMHKPLTERESEVLHLIAQGLPNKLIASRLGIALGTVKAHSKGILAKLDATRRTEAVAVAVRRGLLVDLDSAPTLPQAWRPARPAAAQPVGQPVPWG